MEIEFSDECPHCSKETHLASIIPSSAYSPNGCYFEASDECLSCGKKIKFEASYSWEFEVLENE